MKLLIHFPSSTARPLKFGNWLVISRRILEGMWFLLMLKFMWINVCKRGPEGFVWENESYFAGIYLSVTTGIRRKGTIHIKTHSLHYVFDCDINFAGAGVGVLREYQGNSMGAVAPAPWVARTPAYKVLIIYDKRPLVSPWQDFNCLYHTNIRETYTCLMFPLTIQHVKA